MTLTYPLALLSRLPAMTYPMSVLTYPMSVLTYPMSGSNLSHVWK